MKKKTNWQIRIRITIFIFLASVISVGLIFLAKNLKNHSAFTLKEIIVEEKSEVSSGKRPIPKEQLINEIKQVADVHVKENIFKVNIKALYSSLKINDWVDEIVVRKEFPSTLRIYYKPRKIEAILTTGESLYYVDIKGNAFKIIEPGFNTDFPMVSGCGRLDDECVLNAISVVSYFRTVPDVELSEVNIRLDRTIMAILMHPVRTVLNVGNYVKDTMDIIENRIDRAPKILAEAQRRGMIVKKMDLNFEDRAIVEIQ